MKKEMERKRRKKRRSQMESEGGGVPRGLRLVGRPPPDLSQEGSGDTSLQLIATTHKAQNLITSGDHRINVNEK